jgi:hypothetical protein
MSQCNREVSRSGGGGVSNRGCQLRVCSEGLLQADNGLQV